MKRFLLLYTGPPTPPDASHEGWPQWFEKVGAALVDLGSPMANGVVVRSDGSTSDDAAPLNGYSIIEAADRTDALALVQDHPLLRRGQHAIELFEIPKR